MTDKTLPTLNATSAIADNTLFLVRRNGQISDEKTTGADLKTYFGTGLALSGGTVNNSVIGGVTPAAGTFTTLAANTLDTGQGANELYAMNQNVRTSDSVTFNSLGLTTALSIGNGGTGATTASAARTALGLGTAAVQADTYFLQTANNLSDLANAGTARTNLGLGSLATLSTINNSNWSGTALAVTNGGTGASDASGARTNLGLVIGTDVQAYNANLAAFAGLSLVADRLPYADGIGTLALATFTSFARTLLDDATASDARTTLGLGTIATQAASNVTITGGAITGITDLAVADGGTGASTAGGARTNLGLGTIATQDANNVSISGGAITGITDLAIADGGTGASTASAAFGNLKQDATTAATGVVRMADQAAMGALTTGRAVTADVVHFNPHVPKAWARWDGTGTPALSANRNVSSITDNGVGDYTLNLGITLATQGAALATCTNANRTEAFTANVTALTSTSVRVQIQKYSAGAQDLALLSMAIWGDI